MSNYSSGALLCLAVCVATLSLLASGASAQHRLRYQEYQFDTWCQEEQHLPPRRCDKRLPEDNAAFEAYVDRMETYETQELNHGRRERELERTILNYDPTANPGVPAPSTTVTRPPQ